MNHRSTRGSKLHPLMGVAALCVVLVSCPTAPPTPPAPPPPGPPPPPAPVLKRASKSGAIAISGDDKYVLQANLENDSVTIFRSSTDEKITEVPVGKEPFVVVIHPDDATAFVANREDATVSRITGINTAAPSVSQSVNVGSEPTGLALSPTGATLYVAEFAEGRVSAINTATMQITATKTMRNPRAIAVSNDGDTDDSDEKVVVTEFYGRPGPGAEASDSSRTGVVRLLNPGDLTDAATVEFPPTSPGAFVPTSTGPNLLSSVAIAGNKFFVTATGASPDAAPKFNENVFPLVLVGSLSGSKLGTISLADAIKTQITSGTKTFMADLVDVALVGDNLLYILGRGADAVQRAFLVSDSSVTLGIPAVKQIDLLSQAKKCQNPVGLVTPHDTTVNVKMYVNCWVSRNTAVVNLGQQAVSAVLDASSVPAIGSIDERVNNGRRFYFTGTGRWSSEAWSSCGSCHPDGLSDNITWRFAAGPRQSTSMDGSFSHGAGAPKQRIFNWSGIFDEMHDFERNTRDVSGGVGALVKSATLAETERLSLNKLVASAASPLGGLEKPLRELQEGTPGPTQLETPGPSVKKDWDEINEFVKTIRPPRATRFAAGSVGTGRQIFTDGGCQNCHGGAGWTLSRRFWEPLDQTNKDLLSAAFNGSALGSPHTVQIAAEPNGSNPAIGPAQVACVLRPVGSFGVPGDAAATDPLEKKAGNPPAAQAQGKNSGYNIPSLYGLAVGAPYLHHGQARTLSELFTDDRWATHRLAGNPVFNNGQPLSGQKLTDLLSFLLSLDANAPEISATAGSDKCPAVFP